eukprot:TRINITY_DN4897_c0_g1_i2.p1 TRINITY_DN4897_c0_g1~~TRINITY_DN4897_c0_g1_i2.p1  ORF type:complete len:507 (-),score=27.19 TRINITY_DN4897_c0_g1_i2:134-1447(-)
MIENKAKLQGFSQGSLTWTEYYQSLKVPTVEFSQFGLSITEVLCNFCANPPTTNRESVMENYFIQEYDALRLESQLKLKDSSRTRYLDGRQPDVSLLPKSCSVLTSSNVVVVGEIKVHQGGRFSDDNLGEIATFMSRIFKCQPLRSKVYGFITDCHDIQFLCATKQAEQISFSTTPAYNMAQGKSYLISLVTSPLSVLGYDCPSFYIKNTTLETQMLIGNGVTSHVYKCFYQNTDVAVKRFRSGYQNLLDNEYNIIQDLQGIVGIPKVLWRGTDYFVMIPVGSPVLVFSKSQVGQVLNTLRFVHNKGYVHRDVRPLNFIKFNDKTFLIDWGFSAQTNIAVRYEGTMHFASFRVLNHFTNIPIAPLPQDDLHSFVCCVIATNIAGISEKLYILNDFPSTLQFWQNHFNSPVYLPLIEAINKLDYELVGRLLVAFCTEF